MKIKVLESSEIDKSKWNDYVSKSYNASFYGYTHYLDNICPQWCALIIGNYDYIIPLPYKKFLWFRIVYMPLFTIRFSIFSKNEIDNSFINNIFNFIPSKYKFLAFNIDNFESNNFRFISFKKNYQKLKLDKPYSELYLNYSKSHKKNILKAQKQNIEIFKSTDFDKLISMQKELFIKKSLKIKNKHYLQLSKFFKYVIDNNLAFLLQAKKQDKVYCSVLFFEYKNIVTFFSATNEEGKKNGSFFLLMDYYIRNNSNSPKLIDFAGSSIQGIKERNLGFGAENFEYFSIWSKDLYILYNILKKRR